MSVTIDDLLAEKKRREGIKKSTLLPFSSDDEPEIYDLMDALIERFHPHLEGATIQLVWKPRWTSDDDGIATWAKAKKADELTQKIAGIDFFILISAEVWKQLSNADPKRAAEAAKIKTFIIDHELTHCETKVDSKTLDQAEWDTGEKVWRIRKHDVEDFHCVMERNGARTPSLRAFYKAIKKGTQKDRNLSLEIAAEQSRELEAEGRAILAEAQL